MIKVQFYNKFEISYKSLSPFSDYFSPVIASLLIKLSSFAVIDQINKPGLSWGYVIFNMELKSNNDLHRTQNYYLSNLYTLPTNADNHNWLLQILSKLLIAKYKLIMGWLLDYRPDPNEE